MQTNGFIDAAPSLARWMSRMPADLTRNVTLMLPGVAHNESTDSDAFDCRNAPAFFLTSSDWSYTDYTWHTNRDTYDKINFDNVKRNATLVACSPTRRRRIRRSSRAPAECRRSIPVAGNRCACRRATRRREVGRRASGPDRRGAAPPITDRPLPPHARPGEHIRVLRDL